ncbi:hypothetical protein [Candidatus Sodalis sp. SoCistrobi]|nr:hypothetical protein [Candidatus Sodalis sp. SoCistrobi]
MRFPGVVNTDAGVALLILQPGNGTRHLLPPVTNRLHRDNGKEPPINGSQ